MQKFSLALRTAAMAAMFALIAGSALEAQEGEGGRGGRGRGQRGGEGGQRGQRGGGQRGQRGGGGGFQGFGGGRGGSMFGQRGGGGARTMSKTQLLGIEEVQKELGIEGDQLETVKSAVDAYNEERGKFRGDGGGDREAFSRLREMGEEERNKAIAEMRKKREEAQKEVDKKTKVLDKETEEILAALLEEKQWNRLGEIQVQSTLQGGLMAAMLDKEFAAKLKVTKEQTKKLEEMKKEGEKIATEAREKMMEAFRGGGGGGFDRSAFDEMRKAAEERNKANEKQAEAMLTDGQKKTLQEMKGAKFTFPERQRRSFGGRGGSDRGGRGGRPGRPGGGGEGGSGRPGRPGGGGGDGGAI